MVESGIAVDRVFDDVVVFEIQEFRSHRIKFDGFVDFSKDSAW